MKWLTGVGVGPHDITAGRRYEEWFLGGDPSHINGITHSPKSRTARPVIYTQNKVSATSAEGGQTRTIKTYNNNIARRTEPPLFLCGVPGFAFIPW